MADDNVVIGIEIGDSKKLLETVDDLRQYMEKMAKTIASMPSFSEIVTDGDPNAIKTLNSQVSGLTKEVSQLEKAVKVTGEKGLFNAKEVKTAQNTLESYKRTLSDIGSQISDHFGNTSVDFNATVVAFKNIQDSIQDATEGLDGLYAKQLQATSVKEWEAMSSSIDRARRGIEDSRDALSEMESALAVSDRFGDVLINASTSLNVLEELVSTTREYTTESRKQSIQLTQYNSELLRQLDEMVDRRERLEEIERKTNDPAIRRAALDQLKEINAQIEKQQSLLLANSSEASLLQSILGDSDIVEYAEQQAELREQQLEDEALLREEITLQQEALERLAEIKAATYDVDTLKLIVAKEEEITAEIEKRNKALKEGRDLRTSKVSTLRSSGAGDRIGAELAGGAAAANSIAVLYTNLEKVSTILDKVSPKLVNAFVEFEIGGVQVEEFFLGLGEILEKQRSEFERVLDLQEGILGIATNLTEWGSKVQTANDVLIKSGETLTSLQQRMGGLGKAATGLGGMLTKVAGFAGVAGIAIQGVSFAFDVLSIFSNKAKERTRERIESLKEEISTMRRLNEIFERGSQEERRKAIEDLRDDIAEQQDLINKVTQNADNYTGQIFNQFSNLGTEVYLAADAALKAGQSIESLSGDIKIAAQQIQANNGEVDRFIRLQSDANDEVKAANEAIKGFQDEISKLSSASAVAATNLAAYKNEMERAGEDAVSELEKAQDTLFQERVDILVSEQETQQAMRELQESYNEESTELLEQRNRQDKRLITDHLNDLQQMETQYNEKLKDMRVEYLRESEAMYGDYLNDLSELVREYEDERAETIAEYQEKEQEALAAFQEEVTESHDDYQKKIAKMEEDFNKERIKRQKDLESQLFEAEMDNDALRYFMLQRQGEEEAAEAEAQHKEEMTEAQKDYDESAKERAKQFKEEQAERAKEHEEELELMKEAHTESLAQRKKQYDEEQARAKRAYQDRLDDAEDYYTEERARAAKAHNDRMSDLEDERREEDAARLERLGERRTELEESFQLELEYFDKREELLQSYIDRASNVVDQQERLQEAIDAGGGALSIEDARLLGSSLGNEAARMLRAVGGNEQNFTDEQRAEYNALRTSSRQITRDVNIASNQGLDSVNLNLQELYNNPQWIEAGVFAAESFSDAMSLYFDENLAGMTEGFKRDAAILEIPFDGIYETVEQITASGRTMFQDLSSEHQQFLNDLGLNLEEWNGMTFAEQEDYLRQQREILEAEGIESVATLRQRVDELNDLAIEERESLVDAREAAGQEELDTLERSHTERQQNENQFRDDLLTAGERANEARLEDEEYYNEASQAMSDAAAEEERRQLEEHNETMLEQEANQNTALGELSTEQHEEDLERKEEQHEQEQELNDTIHQLEMERLLLRFERENEMWTLYLEGLATLFEKSSQTIFRNLEKTVGSYGNRIVSTYGNINQAIVQSAADAYNVLVSYMSQAASAAQPTWGSSGKGWGSSGRGGGNMSGLLAAKGALIDEPTLLVAGEGANPELVMPFDESKGIPDDAMRAFAQAFTGGSGVSNEELTPQRVGGGMNDQILTAILTQLTRMEMGMQLRIDNIEVGSNISRQEVREQFGAMQKALVDSLHSSVNMN